jgi:hypothetical protein
MTICSFAALTFLAVSSLSPILAQTSALHYKFTAGETLRFLIQRDPYFADPQGAGDADNPDAPYLAPVVERLTEKVLSVGADGAATLMLTLAPEPGFEDDDHPQAEISRTVTVTPLGKIISVSGAALGNSPAERDLLRGLILLPAVLPRSQDGLWVETRRQPPRVTESTSPDHDGTLRQTTAAAQSDHIVFDTVHGQLVREVSTLTITLSLVMTGRGKRGADDFGPVVPSSTVVQTLSIERRD